MEVCVGQHLSPVESPGFPFLTGVHSRHEGNGVNKSMFLTAHRWNRNQVDRNLRGVGSVLKRSFSLHPRVLATVWLMRLEDTMLLVRSQNHSNEYSNIRAQPITASTVPKATLPNPLGLLTRVTNPLMSPVLNSTQRQLLLRYLIHQAAGSVGPRLELIPSQGGHAPSWSQNQNGSLTMTSPSQTTLSLRR